MPLIIPQDLPANGILQEEQIFTITPQRAKTQDIRPLRVAILNLMPKKEETETQLLRMLSNTPLQVSVDFVRTDSYQSKNTSASHLERFYKTFGDIRHNKYDAMIITGAPVEKMKFEEVDYWQELREIFDFAKTNVFSTMYICWASQAGLYYYYGIEKVEQTEKIFGIFPYKLQNSSMITKGFDDEFYVPQSRYTLNPIYSINNHSALTLIAGCEKTGAAIVTSKDNRQIFVSGHFEYNADTLYQEYLRDKDLGLATAMPSNYFEDEQEKIHVRWRAHANLFFSNWLNYFVYQETPFDIERISQDILPTSREGELINQNQK